MLINSAPELPKEGHGTVGVSLEEPMKVVRNLELFPLPLKIYIEIS